MSHPLHYQVKVLDEKSDLDDKIKNLTEFTAEKGFLPPGHPEKRLLKEQLEAMKRYSDVLKRRINSWENPY